jgi:hypothetical protein
MNVKFEMSQPQTVLNYQIRSAIGAFYSGFASRLKSITRLRPIVAIKAFRLAMIYVMSQRRVSLEQGQQNGNRSSTRHPASNSL